MASFKSATKSALTSATTVLDATTKAVSAAAIGIDMLHEYAVAELQDQRLSNRVNAGKRAAEIVIEAKEAITELQVRAAAYVRKSPEHAAAYKTASAYIDAIVDEMGIANMPKISVAD